MTVTTGLAACAGGGKEVYKDATAPVSERVEDLLGRMTLEEKVGQMNQFVGIEHIKANSAVMTAEELKTNTANAFYPGFTYQDVEKWTEQGLIGSFLHVLTIEEVNYLQRLALKSRLQIPILFGIDAIHGNANAPDNTVYPTNINLACSFDTLMARRIARQTAEEMRAMNMHWTFNPNVEVARDPRWGRVGETFGEDPYLVSLMGAQQVKGYQRHLDSGEDVLACIKHFVGGSEPINGTNGAPADLSERTLREVFFPPFEAGVKAGAMSLMTAHNELNGVPCHSNEWLMTQVLRGEWKFPGFVVSDWMDIEHLHDLHATAENLKEAYYQSIMAGMDMHMHGIHWQELVTELVREGRIPESRIDASVRRILDIKFRLGLFEHPLADEAQSMKIRLSADHRATALEAARDGIVLLKNDSLLPLDPSKYRRVMVTGINADDENILGDWSAQEKPENVTTILEGLRQVAPDTQFDFVDQGWDPRNMDPQRVAEAATHARQADLNIVVAGEYMMRYRWADRTDGEDTDRSDINLVGLQNELIERVAASGKPTVLVLVNGRPLGVQWAAEHLPAIVEAWAPGMYGGQAVAEILYGKVNPSAKLAVTIPRSVGQLQMIYNHKPSQYFHPYAAGQPSTPLYAFGHGLSYTTFEYSDLKLSAKEIAPDGTVEASVKITNTGSRDGVEIAQLYIRDVYSQVTRPVKELKDFARVPLKAGESKTVTFRITPDKLAFYDLQMKKIVEPGEFVVMIGASSEDGKLMKKSFLVISE
ncbi:MAG: glycoside hydrolase family 3 C-terminal domain-containing protein [Mediterranea sp.]|nr:glycoside hydrolase family 3 C-terminal domain-containing protein [Mediterranea sp.]